MTTSTRYGTHPSGSAYTPAAHDGITQRKRHKSPPRPTLSSSRSATTAQTHKSSTAAAADAAPPLLQRCPQLSATAAVPLQLAPLLLLRCSGAHSSAGGLHSSGCTGHRLPGQDGGAVDPRCPVHHQRVPAHKPVGRNKERRYSLARSGEGHQLYDTIDTFGLRWQGLKGSNEQNETALQLCPVHKLACIMDKGGCVGSRLTQEILPVHRWVGKTVARSPAAALVSRMTWQQYKPACLRIRYGFVHSASLAHSLPRRDPLAVAQNKRVVFQAQHKYTP
jgi:hypothetical protein